MGWRPMRSMYLGLFLGIVALAVAPSAASATWSVIALDRESGQVVIASATCVSAEGLRTRGGLMSIQAVVAPGVGVAAAQAGVDRTRENQNLIYRELHEGTHPEQILELLREDPDIERRQFAILDLQGRAAGFSGSENGDAALAVDGQVPGTEIFFSVQGNILASDEVVHDGVDAFLATEGELGDRVMAAMEAADRAGGDRRCTCDTEPIPDAQCTAKTSHVAYIVIADPDDPPGDSHNDGDYFLFTDVDDENIRPHEDANPVVTLRMRYDEWKTEQQAGR